jgi:hypothetical protein
MRPKVILITMFITLAFFLVLMVSPGFWHRKAVNRATVAWIQNPTPENERAIQFEKDKAKRSQYFLCSLAVLNLSAIMIYGGLQHRKRMI